MYSTIPLIAQVVKDESHLAAKPYYISADKMRSNNGKMETIYGQELASSTSLTGVCRGGFSWADLSRQAWAAFGTHLRLQIIDQDGLLYDATPVGERGQLSNPFTVTNGSATITVTDDAHGLVVDQLVGFGTSSAANVLLSSAYAVSSVGSSSSYTFLATSTVANQSTAGVGGTVDYEYSLKPGNVSNLGGLGYGTGGYGSGNYGSASSGQDLDARTWSFAAWGQNLIANNNWGAVYEFAPNITATELINTGNFASSGTWVYGSGWTLGANLSSAASAAKLTQSITLTRSAWHLLRFDVPKVNSGTIIPMIGTSTVGAVITSSGVYKRTFYSPVTTTQTLSFDGSSAFNGQVTNVSCKVLTTANVIPGSPSSAGSVFVTAERNLVACGCTNPTTTLLDPMRVAWSASENNQDWTASAANVAGSYALSHGSRIVRGVAANRENLIFTDTALYRMRSVPDPSVVYAFDLIAEGCGLIGPNAVTVINGVAYWVTKTGKFYQYAGGACAPLANPSERDFRDNLADVQGSKIYVSGFSGQAEVWFFYPDERDSAFGGIECSRYHIYNYMDQTWVSGNYNRTTYIDAGIYPFPLATDSSGGVFYQEKELSNDGSARTTSLETSYFNIGQGSGDNFATVNGVIPDFKGLQGGVAITFYSKLYPQDTNIRSYGPYSITATTKRISVRIKGRQIKYKITTNAAPSWYRMGDITFDLAPSGQKK